MNNGKVFPYWSYKVLTDFSQNTYFFKSDSLENSIKCLFQGTEILGLKIEEIENGLKLFVKLPPNLVCQHFVENRSTEYTINSDEDTHLTYHGHEKGKKLTGEIHISQSGDRIGKDRTNLLEAPVAESSELEIFPLPICRVEFNEIVLPVELNSRIQNYFEIQPFDTFLNTVEIYISRRGWVRNALSAKTDLNEILIGLFFYSNLLTFSEGELGWRGEIMNRRTSRGQVLVVQTHQFEVIIFNTDDKHFPERHRNRIFYFHTKDYFQTIIDRNILIDKKSGSVYIDLESGKKPLNSPYQRFKELLNSKTT